MSPLKTHRKWAGLNQAALGEAIGRTWEAISNTETAKCLSAIDTLIAISEALQVPLNAFFPESNFADNKSPNRVHIEAEITAIVRALSGDSAKIAFGKLRALGQV